MKFSSCEGYTVACLLYYCLLLFSETVLSHRWGFPFLIGIYSPLPMHTQACFCKCYLSDRNIFSFLSPCIVTCTSHQSPKWCPLGSIISLLRPGRRWTALEPCHAFLMKLISWKMWQGESYVKNGKQKRRSSYIRSLSFFLFLPVVRSSITLLNHLLHLLN